MSGRAWEAGGGAHWRGVERAKGKMLSEGG